MSKLKKLREKNKSKLDESDFNQALEYHYVMMTAYITMMEKCNVTKVWPINNKYNSVCQALLDLYQTIGTESTKHK